MEHEAEVAGLRQRFKAELRSALSHKDVQALRDRFLGRKAGLVTALYGRLATLEADAKKTFGKLLNELKQEITTDLEVQDRAVHTVAELPRLDPTLAGRRPVIGHIHPLTYLRTRIEAYFAAAGYEILDGPETEDDYHNFEALNLPADHPARDMQDTLYLERPWARTVFPVGAERSPERGPEHGSETLRAGRPEAPATLLRTHTSAMQIRYMERHAPPVRIICPGRVYRRDNLDQTHTPMFQQVEGLVVGEGVTMAQLKGTLVAFLRDLFGERVEITFRPSFFPYTEPSADVFLRDASRVDGGRGPKWLEVLGCGMVNPAVFEAVGYDPERYTGFAFGMGIERLAMLLFGVDDIRQFYENDVRFLEQFPQ
jgi:phenylalanyl-tRNA synthetase alpha chain